MNTQNRDFLMISSDYDSSEKNDIQFRPDFKWKHFYFRDKLGFWGWLKRPLKI